MGWLEPVAECQALGSADSQRLREAAPDASPLSSEEARLREGKSHQEADLKGFKQNRDTILCMDKRVEE